MPAVGPTLTITKIDGTNVGSSAVPISGNGPWKVEGTASASAGFSISYLAYDYDVSVPSTDIDRTNLPDWQFFLTDTIVPTGAEFPFSVTALDNQDPQMGRTVAAAVLRSAGPAPKRV